MSRLLVIGGGITGLSAAWEAMQTGAEVTLVEAADQLGGKVRTEQVEGLLIEHGPDSFVSYRPAALALADELGLADDVIAANPGRTVHLRAGGRMLPLPDGMGMVLPTRMGPFVTTRILTWRQKVRAGVDVLLPRRLPDDDISAGEFLRARLGDGVVDRIAQPLIGGIYGAGIDELSLDAVLPTLRTSEQEHRSLMLASLAQGRAARRRAKEAGAPVTGSPFRSLRGGMGSLVDQLESRLRAGGVTIRRGTRVERLDRDVVGGGGTILATFALTADGTADAAAPGTATGSSEDAGRDGLERFDAAVLAVGAKAMADLLESHAPAAASALRSIPHATSAVVTLAYPNAAFDGRGEDSVAHPAPAAAGIPTSQGWLESDEAPISGVTISSNKWINRAPPGFVLLRAFVPQRRGPLAMAPEDEILRVVANHVADVLGASGEPSLTRVTRWNHAMPKYTVGHLARVATVEAAMKELPGWHVAGSALHGVGVPECIADGRRAARLAVSR
jgi:oxygen-dependent protoporphyrinogen oxidase